MVLATRTEGLLTSKGVLGRLSGRAVRDDTGTHLPALAHQMSAEEGSRMGRDKKWIWVEWRARSARAVGRGLYLDGVAPVHPHVPLQMAGTRGGIVAPDHRALERPFSRVAAHVLHQMPRLRGRVGAAWPSADVGAFAGVGAHVPLHVPGARGLVGAPRPVALEAPRPLHAAGAARLRLILAHVRRTRR